MDGIRGSNKISRRRFLEQSGMVVSGLLYGCTRLGKQKLDGTSPDNISPAISLNNPDTANQSADLILRNGNVLTMDSSGSRKQAIAIKGDKILAVGSDKDMTPFTGDSTKVLDTRGKVITPGLIDPHNHFRLVGLQNSYYTGFMPPEVTNTQTLQQALKEYLKTKKPGEWVMAYYLVLQDNMTPDKSYLDPVSKDNPVFLFHIGGHWGTANSAALKIANVNASTKSPEGGIIQKDASGEPNGLLFNHRAMDVVRRFAPPIEPELVSRSIIETQTLFAACGVTSFQDNNVRSLEDIAMYRQLTEDGKLLLRNDLYLTLEWPSDLKSKADVQEPFDNGVTRFKGYKFLLDGQTPTAYCHQPHNGTAWDISTWEPEEYKKTVRSLHDTGLQICTHCVGDAAADLALDAYEAAMNANPRNDPRHRIEHAILTTKKATQRMKDLGVVVSTNPHFLYIGGDSYENIFGAQLADRIMVTREWMEAGVHVAIGSDAPTTPFYTPQATMAGAITRLTLSRKVLNKEQSLTIEESLKAHTYEAAYAAHEENEKGTLEPGKLADVVVWEDDPTKQSIADLIRTTRVNITLVGGKVVFQA